MSKEHIPVVIDNGTLYTKAGFAGEEDPQLVFPTIVGCPKFKAAIAAGKNKDAYIGEEATEKSGILIRKHPIDLGIIKDWDNIEKLWQYTYSKLKINPSEHLVLFTEPANNPKANRQRLIQIMFETFNVPSFSLDMQAVLSLYSSNQHTGVILESGGSITNIVPIINGRPFIDSIKSINFGGHDVSLYFEKIMNDSSSRVDKFNVTVNLDSAVEIKEKCTFVALDFDTELQKAQETHYCDMTFTSEKTESMIEIGDERFRCPEILFKPFLNGLEFDGFDKSIFDSIEKCNVGIRKDLYRNIFTAGGNTLFPCLQERLTKEIKNLAPNGTEVKVEKLSAKYPAWRGGSILASGDSFAKKAVSRDEYNDQGSDVVNRKCIY